MTIIGKIEYKILRALKFQTSKFGFKVSVIGKNNIIQNRGNVKNSVIDIIGNNNTISLAKGVNLFNTLIFLRGDGHNLIIEEDCRISGGSLWMEDSSCKIHIGSKTTIEDAHLAATEPGKRIKIGVDCMLANHIEIRTGDSHSVIDIHTGRRINQADDVTLENHVWVGAHAKILKGVTVGQNSIIGTGAIVTRSIPSNSIAAGIPSKLIRSGINWSRERI